MGFEYSIVSGLDGSAAGGVVEGNGLGGGTKVEGAVGGITAVKGIIGVITTGVEGAVGGIDGVAGSGGVTTTGGALGTIEGIVDNVVLGDVAGTGGSIVGAVSGITVSLALAGKRLGGAIDGCSRSTGSGIAGVPPVFEVPAVTNPSVELGALGIVGTLGNEAGITVAGIDGGIAALGVEAGTSGTT